MTRLKTLNDLKKEYGDNFGSAAIWGDLKKIAKKWVTAIEEGRIYLSDAARIQVAGWIKNFFGLMDVNDTMASILKNENITGQPEPWCLLSLRYKPTKDSYGSEHDGKGNVKLKFNNQDDQDKFLDFFCNGDAYPAHVIENKLYNKLQQDFNIMYHLYMRGCEGINGAKILEAWIKSINNGFDKDKRLII